METSQLNENGKSVDLVNVVGKNTKESKTVELLTKEGQQSKLPSARDGKSRLHSEQ